MPLDGDDMDWEEVAAIEVDKAVAEATAAAPTTAADGAKEVWPFNWFVLVG